MFGSLASFTEGFKRLSLDALQDEEEGQTGKQQEHQQQEQVNKTELISSTPQSRQLPPDVLPVTAAAADRRSGEKDDWDWDQEKTETEKKAGNRIRTTLGARAAVCMNIVSTDGINKLENACARDVATDDVTLDSVPPQKEIIDLEITEEIKLPDGESGLGVGRPNVEPHPEVSFDTASPAVETAGVVGAGQEDAVTLPAAGASDGVDLGNIADATVKNQGRPCGASVSDADKGAVSATGGLSAYASGRKAEAQETDHDDILEANAPEVTHVIDDSASGGEGAVAADTVDHALPDLKVSGNLDNASAEAVCDPLAETQQPVGQSTGIGYATPAVYVGNEESSEVSSADVEALAQARKELMAAKKLASVLEDALGKSRSEVNDLREELATQKSAAQEQARSMARLRDDVEATRIGYRESNEAHQRTAERAQGMEQALRVAREAADGLKAEKSSLLAQLNVAVGGRQELEAQLRQLRVGLAEDQEAARQENRQEAERLEARVKELLKDRDRKQAELDLQHARRKETRDMARDLESQLAAVDRIAQEREVELNKLREERVSLKREADEAREKEATWATKHEALERNFKQVRAQGRNVDSELDQLRRKIARLETEKATLADRVEEEGAERVTMVSSISHERDFLLRQVDRLEKEMGDLRQEQEAQAVEAAARMRTSGVLEEYRTRAQQALKRANEITSQTASENKRLEAEIAKLSAEVSRERPQWTKWKEAEEACLAEMAEVKEKLAKAETDCGTAATSLVALQERLARQEEEKSRTHAAIVRLEAQGKSLKQELQRQQRALYAAQERESVLQARLAEKDCALNALEDRRKQQQLASPRETKSDKDSFTPSPRNPNLSPSLSWDDEKQPGRKGTGSEGGETTLKDARSGNGRDSFRSTSSEGEYVDVSTAGMAEQLVYVHQLRERRSKEHVEMRSLVSELEASRAAIDAQATKEAKLEKQLEAALLANTRLQELDQGRNAAVNLEYLKNCVVGCLRTSEPSEHARLLPVITTILKLSKQEAEVIAKSISERARHEGSFGGGLAPVGAGAGGGGWWNSKLQKK